MSAHPHAIAAIRARSCRVEGAPGLPSALTEKWVRMGGVGRFIGRVAVCLPLSLLVSAWLLLRAGHPAPETQNHGYYWAVAVMVSTAAMAFALLQAASHRTPGLAVGLSVVGAFTAFFVGGFLFGTI